MANRTRTWALLGLVLLAAGVVGRQPSQEPDSGMHTHRDGFSGRQTAWLPGESNVRIAEKDHRIAEDRYFNAPSSEYLKIEGAPASNTSDAEFAYYFYETPPAPLTERTAASLWLKAFRAGIQLRARVVFPRERDPANPEVPLTTLIVGESYPEDKVRQWHRVRLMNPMDALRKQYAVLTARLGHQVDPTDAYIDRLVLNVYPGPGVTEIWVDDLEIGPCRPDPRKPGGNRSPAATPTGRAVPAVSHPYNVEFIAGKVLIDKKPFFMRMIRHTDTGTQALKDLRDAKFNTVYFPSDAEPTLIDEAVTRHQFMVMAGVPELSMDSQVAAGALERDADKLAEHFRRFRSGDGVLMWDLGGGRTLEQIQGVARMADLLREYDPRRPRAVDIWDGYQSYADSLDVIGTHRWPLFTSLELERYRQWLVQRKTLTGPGKLMWTWVQTHMPDWYIHLASRTPSGAMRNPATGIAGDAQLAAGMPLGPQPEQLRLLTYMSVAAGCRGLGFWSDRFLSNSHYGRDRLIELFLLNCELELLEPVLFSIEDEKTQWVETSHPDVRAAIMRGKKGIIVLPIWLGAGNQYAAEQGALTQLKIKVPLVPEASDPWLLTPASYHNLRASGGVKNVPPGVEITIPQFDMTAAVVFTQDAADPEGLVVRWQDNIRHVFGRRAAEYAKEQAIEVYNKTLMVHEQLRDLAPPVAGTEDLFRQAYRSIRQAEKYLDNAQPDMAYREARRALRPLRLYMREHWQAATQSLTTPTASPYAISYYTLPQHWELAYQMQASNPGDNQLPHGGFELGGSIPKGGAAVESLPGWSIRQATLDPVELKAAIIEASKVADEPLEPNIPGFNSRAIRERYSSSRIEALRYPAESAGPESGKHALYLSVTAKKPKGAAKDAKPPRLGILERTFLAVDSPLVEFSPGTWVRISFWAKVEGVGASADGLLIYDSVGGEPLAARIFNTVDRSDRRNLNPPVRWKEFHLYRQVPSSGQIGLTIAMTGTGEAFVDDVRIVPMMPATPVESQKPGLAPAGDTPPGPLTRRP